MADKVRTGGTKGRAYAKWFAWFRERQADCWTGGRNEKKQAKTCATCGEPIRVGELLMVKIVHVGKRKGGLPKRRTRWEYWHRECWNKTWR
ncbi:MAG: hypothetical protein KAY24_00035 [Candidatus Eisenbacteria sp.]|nr:hypothetical protein [Candidatus Eisenbacteria bacterium]